MKTQAWSATIERQIWSRFRSRSFWVGAAAPVFLVGLLLFQTAKATDNPSSTMFLAILSALWIGGSSSVREIVDERKLVQRDPHLSLFAYGLAKILNATLLAGTQSAILAAFLFSSGVVKIPVVWLWAIVAMTALSGAMLALVLSALCDEPATALAWFPLLLVPQVVFGGFLFSYSPATPFAISAETGQAIVMPAALRRAPVRHWSMRAAGALCVARWALEAFAAETVEQDLENHAQLESAAQVAGFIPLTLAEEPSSEALLRYVEGRAGGGADQPPKLVAHSTQYLFILLLFAFVQASILVVILPLRDARRI